MSQNMILIRAVDVIDQGKTTLEGFRSGFKKWKASLAVIRGI